MADFTSVQTISNNIHSAEEVLVLFKQIYKLGKRVNMILDRYNTDLPFKTEADHLFSSEQLTEIETMINNVQSLTNDWETNHVGALGSAINEAI
jgi:hypothetical protein